jgi:hypothetical protein
MRCHQSVRSHKRTSCGRVGRGIAGASTAFAAIAAAARFAGFAREEGALCGRCWLRSDTAAGGDAAGAECAAEVLGMHGIQGGRASEECGGQACGGLHCVRLVGCGSGGSIRSRAGVSCKCEAALAWLERRGARGAVRSAVDVDPQRMEDFE